MKPVTPLRAENGPKMAVSCEQRCQWLQTCAVRSSQRCRRFHLEAVSHPHWCHRFQARWSVGVVRRLWHPSARQNSPSRSGLWAKPRQNSPSRRKKADFGVFCVRWANFFARGRRRRGAGRILSRLWGLDAGGEAWLRCPWAVLGTGCGARGRWRGLAGLRGAAPSEARSPSLAGGRGLRRPEHQRRHTGSKAAATQRKMPT